MPENGNRLDSLYAQYVERYKVKGEYLPLNRISVVRTAGECTAGRPHLCPQYAHIRSCAGILGIRSDELESAEHFCGVIVDPEGEKEVTYRFCSFLLSLMGKRLEMLSVNANGEKRAAAIKIAREAYLTSANGHRDDPDEAVVTWTMNRYDALERCTKNLSPRVCCTIGRKW